jgi:hypothetical protein
MEVMYLRPNTPILPYSNTPFPYLLRLGVFRQFSVACPEQSRRACPERSRGACPEQSRRSLS